MKCELFELPANIEQWDCETNPCIACSGKSEETTIFYPTRRRGSRPHVRDKVWVEGRKEANGKIVRIDWTCDPKECIVLFDHGQETYTFEDLDGRWTDKFGGSYMIEAEYEED